MIYANAKVTLTHFTRMSRRKFAPKINSIDATSDNDKSENTTPSPPPLKQNKDQKAKVIKDITFKFENPKTKTKESKSIQITNNMSISNIIQIFNDWFEVTDIIGFKGNSTEFKKDNTMLFSETNLNYMDDSSPIEISFIFDINSKLPEPEKETKIEKQQINIIYFNEVKTAQIDFSTPYLKLFESMSKFSIYGRKKIVLYFPGGNMMTMPFNDFIIANGQCQKILYAISYQSKFEPEKAFTKVDISKKSITELFPDIKDSKYVCLLCCILKYINMRLYKSLHIIKSFFETITFVPFLTSLNNIYNDNVTKLSLFTIVSFLQFYAPETEKLRRLFSTMSYYACKISFSTFLNYQNPDFSFKHDLKKAPQLPPSSNCFNNCYNAWNPIFIANFKQLSSRKYWSIVLYDTGYILCNIDSNEKNPSRLSNTIIYYDPTQGNDLLRMEATKLNEYEKKSPNPNKSEPQEHQPPYSQVTVSIIDYSSSMIACFDEKGVRRSKVAVEIVNQFTQAGKDNCVNDPFVLFDFQCNETDYPLEYNQDNFLKPSRVYDRINRGIKYLTSESLSKNMDDKTYKRIFLVSDGQGDNSQINKYTILDNLCKNRIILDVILLKQGETSKDLCYISHISKGEYYCPHNLDDAYFISKYQNLIKISGKEKIFNFMPHRSVSEEEFSKGSERIRIKNTINALRIQIQKDFYKKTDLYSPFSVIKCPIKNMQELRIQKEIDICARYQQTMQQIGKEPFFMIYRIFMSNKNTNPNKALVFLKGNPNSKIKVIHQVMITFGCFYPFEMPDIQIQSLAKLDTIVLPDEILDEPYKPETRLIDILMALNNNLKCIENPIEKDNDLDPMKHLDQIKLVFNVYEDEARDIKKSYDKHFKKYK